jgi:hypothetical protein
MSTGSKAFGAQVAAHRTAVKPGYLAEDKKDPAGNTQDRVNGASQKVSSTSPW